MRSALLGAALLSSFAKGQITLGCDSDVQVLSFDFYSYSQPSGCAMAQLNGSCAVPAPPSAVALPGLALADVAPAGLAALQAAAAPLPVRSVSVWQDPAGNSMWVAEFSGGRPPLETLSAALSNRTWSGAPAAAPVPPDFQPAPVGVIAPAGVPLVAASLGAASAGRPPLGAFQTAAGTAFYAFGGAGASETAFGLAGGTPAALQAVQAGLRDAYDAPADLVAAAFQDDAMTVVSRSAAPAPLGLAAHVDYNLADAPPSPAAPWAPTISLPLARANLASVNASAAAPTLASCLGAPPDSLRLQTATFSPATVNLTFQAVLPLAAAAVAPLGDCMLLGGAVDDLAAVGLPVANLTLLTATALPANALSPPVRSAFAAAACQARFMF